MCETKICRAGGVLCYESSFKLAVTLLHFEGYKAYCSSRTFMGDTPFLYPLCTASLLPEADPGARPNKIHPHRYDMAPVDLERTGHS